LGDIAGNRDGATTGCFDRFPYFHDIAFGFLTQVVQNQVSSMIGSSLYDVQILHVNSQITA
jgi:hypothetical protein